MTDPAAKDKMKGNHEMFPVFSKGSASSSNSQKSGDVIQWFPEPKEAKDSSAWDSTKANNLMMWEPYAKSDQGYSGPFYSQETVAQPYLHPDFVMSQQVQLNAFENNIYQMNHDYLFPVENRYSYMPPAEMFCRAHPDQVQVQEFQYFVVIDFEATCDKERKLRPQEIIEFPSVVVNGATAKLEAFFQTYVRPAYHQHLTDYCKELTGIQQIQVDRGVPLSEALIMHDKWLEKKGIKHKNFAVVTWGDWDCRTMLESESLFKGIRKPAYFNRWINLKVPFQEMFQGVRCGLKDAVQRAGLTWEGREHCGLDDARNTAHLLVHLMNMGYKLSITNSLMPQTTNFPIKNEHDFLLDHNQQTQKPEELVGASDQFHPPSGKESDTYCYCGALSKRCIVRKPGPNQGRFFFGCGNWTAGRGAVCDYFVWASL